MTLRTDVTEQSSHSPIASILSSLVIGAGLSLALSACAFAKGMHYSMIASDCSNQPDICASTCKERPGSAQCDALSVMQAEKVLQSQASDQDQVWADNNGIKAMCVDGFSRACAVQHALSERVAQSKHDREPNIAWAWIYSYTEVVGELPHHGGKLERVYRLEVRADETAHLTADGYQMGFAADCTVLRDATGLVVRAKETTESMFMTVQAGEVLFRLDWDEGKLVTIWHRVAPDGCKSGESCMMPDVLATPPKINERNRAADLLIRLNALEAGIKSHYDDSRLPSFRDANAAFGDAQRGKASPKAGLLVSLAEAAQDRAVADLADQALRKQKAAAARQGQQEAADAAAAMQRVRAEKDELERAEFATKCTTDFDGCEATCVSDARSNACLPVGFGYENGVPSKPTPNHAKAFYYADRSCRAGVTTNCRLLKYLHKQARECSSIAECSAYCSSKLAEGCDAASILYADGDGVPRSTATAVAFLVKACDLDLAISCQKLGNAYARGDGTPRNPDKAAVALGKGCSAGDNISCALRERLCLETRRCQ